MSEFSEVSPPAELLRELLKEDVASAWKKEPTSYTTEIHDEMAKALGELAKTAPKRPKKELTLDLGPEGEPSDTARREYATQLLQTGGGEMLKTFTALESTDELVPFISRLDVLLIVSIDPATSLMSPHQIDRLVETLRATLSFRPEKFESSLSPIVIGKIRHAVGILSSGPRGVEFRWFPYVEKPYQREEVVDSLSQLPTEALAKPTGECVEQIEFAQDRALNNLLEKYDGTGSGFVIPVVGLSRQSSLGAAWNKDWLVNRLKTPVVNVIPLVDKPDLEIPAVEKPNVQ